MRCLIVDDNPRFLVAATDLLEGEGITVVAVASTAAEALQQTEAARPDVTLVDVDLGTESGFDLARRLTLDGGQSGSSVILISTYAEGDFADLIRDSPAIGFLSKSDLSAEGIRALLGGQS